METKPSFPKCRNCKQKLGYKHLKKMRYTPSIGYQEIYECDCGDGVIVTIKETDKQSNKE